MYEVDQLVPYPAPMCLVLSVVLALLPGAECTVIMARGCPGFGPWSVCLLHRTFLLGIPATPNRNILEFLE